MLRIRFFRVGKKNQPSFKIVVTDKRNPPKGGRFLEELGFWNPLTKEKILHQERIKFWITRGAQPSDSVYNLLVSQQIIKAKKKPVHKKAKNREKAKQEVKAEAKEGVKSDTKTDAKTEGKEDIKVEKVKTKEPSPGQNEGN